MFLFFRAYEPCRVGTGVEREHELSSLDQVQVKGRSIICKLNGKTVLTADDDGPSSGTAGVCCAGDGSGVLFDNLEVRLLR